MIVLAWRLEKQINDLLGFLTGSKNTLRSELGQVGKANRGPLVALYENPPTFLKELIEAFEKSWKEEDLRWLRAYQFRYKKEWNDLEKVTEEWSEAVKKNWKLRDTQSLRRWVSAQQEARPDFLHHPRPEVIDPQIMDSWLREWQNDVRFIVTSVINGQVPGVSNDVLGSPAEVSALLDRTDQLLNILLKRN